MVSPARSRRTIVRHVLVSLAIVVGAVLNSAQGCNPVEASPETVIESFTIEGPALSLLGDTLYLSIVATSPGSNENVFKMAPVWSSGSPVAAILSQGSSSSRDVAQYKLTAVGNAVITAAATVGKLASGGTPSSSRDIRVVALPVRVRFQNVPATMRVTESANAGAMLEGANGERYTTSRLPVLTVASPALVQLEPNQDVLKLTGLAPGVVTLHAFIADFDMRRVGISGPLFSQETSLTIIGPAQTVIFSPPGGQLLVSQTMSVTAAASDAVQSPVPGIVLEVSSLTPTVASAALTGTNSFTVTALSTGGAQQATARIRVTTRDGAFATLVRDYEVVVGGRVSSVIVTPPGNTRLAIQQQLAFSASVALLPGSPTSPAPPVLWESSDQTKVSVTPQGVAKALANTGSTPAIITAVSEGVRSNGPTVQVGPLAMRMVDASFTGTIGSTKQLTLQELNAIGAPIAGAFVSAADVDWLSSNTAVVTVDAQGLATCAAVGTATVSATLRGTTVTAFATGTCSVIGNSNPVVGMMLDPIELTVPLGQVAVYQARLLDAQGQETAPGAGFQVVYTATTSAIAQLANGPTSGRFTTKALGTTGIIAYYAPLNGDPPNLSSSSFLRVGSTAAGSVANVRITTTHVLGFVGLSFGFTAVAIDGAGNTMSGVVFRWGSSSPTSVNVNASTGIASGLAAGGAMITASAVLPNDDSGPTGIAFMTVRPRGAVVADINLPDGAPAVGASLRAFQGGVQVGRGVVPVANASPGRVYIAGLAAGSYTVTVSLPGFSVRTFTTVVVTADQVTQLNAGTAIVLVPQP